MKKMPHRRMNTFKNSKTIIKHCKKNMSLNCFNVKANLICVLFISVPFSMRSLIETMKIMLDRSYLFVEVFERTTSIRRLLSQRIWLFVLPKFNKTNKISPSLIWNSEHLIWRFKQKKFNYQAINASPNLLLFP